MFFSEVVSIPFEKALSYSLVDIIHNSESEIVRIFLKCDFVLDESKKFALVTFPFSGASRDEIKIEYFESGVSCGSVLPSPKLLREGDHSEDLVIDTPHYTIEDDCVKIGEKKIPYIRNKNDVEMEVGYWGERRVIPFDIEKSYNIDLYQPKEEFLFIFNFEGKYDTPLRRINNSFNGRYHTVRGFVVRKITLSIINLITGRCKPNIFQTPLQGKWLLPKNYKFDIVLNRKDGYIEITDLCILMDSDISWVIDSRWTSSDRKFYLSQEKGFFILSKIHFSGEREGDSSPSSSSTEEEEEKSSKEISTQTESNIPMSIIEKLEKYYSEKSQE